MRSFQNASAIQPGFDTSNILLARYYLSSAGYTGPQQIKFCQQVRQRLEGRAGIVGVSYSDVVPLDFGSSPWHQLSVDGYTPAPNEDMTIHRALVSPGYFDLLRIPLLEGRDFTEQDDENAPNVMIVNQAFVRRFFGGRSPIGRTVRYDGRVLRVVGVVRDAKYSSPAESPQPYYYAPFRKIFSPGLNFTLFVKTQGDPLAAVPLLRREAAVVDPDATSFTALTFAEATAAGVYPQKVAASLLGVLGSVSLLLAAIGLYSVISYAVSQRVQEVGIRMAMGARPGDVILLVMRQGLLLTAGGLAAGLAVSLALSYLVAGMLVNVSATDPFTLGATGALLMLFSLPASFLPALRATRVDPISALRAQ